MKQDKDKAEFTLGAVEMAQMEALAKINYFRQLQIVAPGAKAKTVTTAPGANGVVEQVNYSSKAEQQEDEILRIIEEVLLLKPLHLPQVKKGKAGTKAAVRKQLGIPSNLFVSDKVFNTAWERLRANNKVKESE